MCSGTHEKNVNNNIWLVQAENRSCYQVLHGHLLSLRRETAILGLSWKWPSFHNDCYCYPCRLHLTRAFDVCLLGIYPIIILYLLAIFVKIETKLEMTLIYVTIHMVIKHVKSIRYFRKFYKTYVFFHISQPGDGSSNVCDPLLLWWSMEKWCQNKQVSITVLTHKCPSVNP